MGGRLGRGGGMSMATLLLAASSSRALLLAAALRPTTPPVVWQGTMSYPCTSDCGGVKWLVHEGPIAITVDAAVASTNWTWTVLPVPGHAARHCVPKREVGLNVQSPAAGTAAGRWCARGSSSETSFYSLEAMISADGHTLSDGVIYFGGNQSAGTFAARRDAPPANSTCVPPPPKPPPPPPGPGLWPLPANFSMGNQTISLSPRFSFHCTSSDGAGGGETGSLLQTAFERFHNQIFAEHGGAGSGTAVVGQQLGILNVHVDSADERKTLQLGMDESYSLEIVELPIDSTGGNKFQATLSAPAVWGVRQSFNFCEVRRL